jgi:hypothetical protein
MLSAPPARMTRLRRDPPDFDRLTRALSEIDHRLSVIRTLADVLVQTGTGWRDDEEKRTDDGGPDDRPGR